MQSRVTACSRSLSFGCKGGALQAVPGTLGAQTFSCGLCFAFVSLGVVKVGTISCPVSSASTVPAAPPGTGAARGLVAGHLWVSSSTEGT